MAAKPIENPEDFPNLLAGSFSDGRKFSTGNTLPLIARPWGFNHWSIQTNDAKTSWWFMGNEHEFHWMRLTHQPSPWIGDWAYLSFGPQMGGWADEPTMFFEPWGAKIKPYTFDATLGPDNMRVQLTPTDHGAVLQMTFPAVNPNNYEKRICFKIPAAGKAKTPASHFDRMSNEEMWLELTTVRAESVPGNFGMYVRVEVDKKSLAHQQGGHISDHGMSRCFEFSPQETAVTAWLATSLISTEQARLNLEREVRGRRFEAVEEESRNVWRSLLRRVDIVDPGPMNEATFRRVGSFYTGLYRALLFPRRLDEIDASGRRVHYSPYDPKGGVHDGILVTDTGFWDTFRTVYTLLSLVYPNELGEIITGWLNAYKEGSWLPEWSSPGYRSCMVGTFADVVIADAVNKGIPGIDVQLAWQALSKDSFVPGGGKGQGGKAGYNDYDSLGFIPASTADSVSGTLDFAFSDFAVSLAAEKLGRSGDAQRLRKRALGAREHLFDHGSGIMRPKQRNGAFKYAELNQWGDGYVEGSAWHHSFPAFDLPGLAALHGSKRKLAAKINDVVTTPGTFRPGTYRTTIHEMTEMRALGMGQYGHNNQPVHHILWLLLMLDEAGPECNATAPSSAGAFCPRRLAEDYIGAVLRKAYGVDFYAGDEDNGEMGAWYVLAALGLFESAPGTYQGYTLGSPIFRRVDIHRQPLGNDPTMKVAPLTILSPGAGTQDVIHVSRVLLNGKDIGPDPSAVKSSELTWSLQYDRLVEAMPGAVLQFLGDSPGTEVGQAAEPVHNATEVQWQKLRITLQDKVRDLEGKLEDQKKLQQRVARPADPGPAGVSDRQVSNNVEEAQRLQIHSLERQLEELRRQPKGGGDELSSGLATTVEMAFFILVAVNALGWILCVCYRSGGKVAPGGSSSRKSKRTGVPNGKRRGDQMV